MSLQVYDYRTDIRNILVTPQIRCRFLRMEIGQVNRSHSHDLGHEVFLILQGRAEFEIEGQKEILGPGQMCIALADERHIVRNVGDKPVIMYLSVTPHIQPTHTSWTEAGMREPPRFSPSTTYDMPPDRITPTEELIDRLLNAIEVLTGMVEATASVQREQAAAFKEALTEGDEDSVLRARDTMWSGLCTIFRQVYEVADRWNNFTSRTADSEF